MSDSLGLSLQNAQKLALVQELRKCNEISERYGLSLGEEQISVLTAARSDALRATGRIEMGESVLPKLIYAFCDSPYLFRDSYCSTLGALQELFYTFKNELNDELSDDELIEAMARLFNHRAQGSLEYLENCTTGDLYQAWQRTDDEEEQDDD